MQFDLSKFLAFMLEAFLACREDIEELTPTSAIRNRRAVRRAVKRGLRQQARQLGASRRERREFIESNIEAAVSAVEREVDKL